MFSHFIFNLFIPMGFSFVDSSSSIQSLGEYHLTKSSIVQPGLAALKDSMSDTRQALCILALSWAPSDDVPSLQWNERLFTIYYLGTGTSSSFFFRFTLETKKSCLSKKIIKKVMQQDFGTVRFVKYIYILIT